MEDMIKIIAMQTKLNDCIIKKIASMQGQITANTFFIGCIIGYLMITRKK